MERKNENVVKFESLIKKEDDSLHLSRRQNSQFM
jgi:hypothetical protein